MFGSITALFTAIANFFKLKEVKTEKQVETIGIKEFKKQKKALKLAERIIELVETKGYFDTLSSQTRFETFKKQFRSLL